MCEVCARALNQFFPQASEEEAARLLWEVTPFPAGSGLEVWWSLKRAADASGGDVERAIAHAYAELDRILAKSQGSEI